MPYVIRSTRAKRGSRLPDISNTKTYSEFGLAKAEAVKRVQSAKARLEAQGYRAILSKRLKEITRQSPDITIHKGPDLFLYVVVEWIEPTPPPKKHKVYRITSTLFPDVEPIPHRTFIAAKLDMTAQLRRIKEALRHAGHVVTVDQPVKSLNTQYTTSEIKVDVNDKYFATLTITATDEYLEN